MNSSNCAGDYEMMAPRSQLHSSPVVMQAWSRSRCQYNSGAVLKNLESVTERNALAGAALVTGEVDSSFVKLATERGELPSSMSAQTRDACNLKKPCPQAAQKRMANLCASEYVTVRIAAVKGLSVKKFKLAAEKHPICLQ